MKSIKIFLTVLCFSILASSCIDNGPLTKDYIFSFTPSGDLTKFFDLNAVVIKNGKDSTRTQLTAVDEMWSKTFLNIPDADSYTYYIKLAKKAGVAAPTDSIKIKYAYKDVLSNKSGDKVMSTMEFSNSPDFKIHKDSLDSFVAKNKVLHLFLR